LQLFLAFFFLGFAALGVVYAKQAWRAPRPRSGLEPATFWPYSPQRWVNMVRALPWGTAAFDAALLAVAVVNLDAAGRPIARVVVAFAGLLMVVFVLLTAFGRPRRLLSPHF
jgi:hypothetical protein